VVFGGNGLRLVLGKGCMSEIGIQVSYSSSFLGIQHSQRSSLKCHIISESCRRAHSFSVMPLFLLKASQGILQAKIVIKKNCRRNGLLAFIIATEKINSSIDYFKYIPRNLFFLQKALVHGMDNSHIWVGIRIEPRSV